MRSSVYKFVQMDVGSFCLNAAKFRNKRIYRYSEGSQKLLCYSSDSNPCRCFPGARPLKNVSHITDIILDGSGQVSVPGTRAGHPDAVVLESGFRRHLLAPVLPVTINDRESDRRSQRFPPPYAG